MDKSITIYCISLFCFIAIVFFFAIYYSKTETKGALYFNKDEKSVFVCDGILKTHSLYTTQYMFICNDGKIITNLTNFTLKAVEK